METETRSQAGDSQAGSAAGTRRKLTEDQEREVTRLYADTETPVSEISKRFGIGESSVYRVAQRHGAWASGGCRDRRSQGSDATGKWSPEAGCSCSRRCTGNAGEARTSARQWCRDRWSGGTRSNRRTARTPAARRNGRDSRCRWQLPGEFCGRPSVQSRHNGGCDPSSRSGWRDRHHRH